MVVEAVKAMRVMVAHNAYQQRGGEDSVVDAEVAMLRQRGHEVQSYMRHNDELNNMSTLSAAAQMVWSRRTVAEAQRLIEAFQPSVLHVHNTFPLMSPALYWAAAEAGVPVVQTLHNFRLHCPQAMYLRDGVVCEDCLGKVPWRGAVRGCYRDSKLQSSALVGMVVTHRMLGTWQSKVTRYIALNKFCRDKFVEGGLPADRVVIKPNFVDFAAPLPLVRTGFLFVGRLSAEKGVRVLVEAAHQVPGAEIRVAGDGPEADVVVGHRQVKALGRLSSHEVRVQMASSLALVLPSIWYENFPMTLVEAMGCGLPVIASRIGALAELIEDGVTGLLFEPGNADDLAQKMQWALTHADAMSAMGKAARQRYESRYTANENYQQLLAIYQEAIATKNKEFKS